MTTEIVDVEMSVTIPLALQFATVVINASNYCHHIPLP